jgi:tetratricopeptide (TPR) repeat protein
MRLPLAPLLLALPLLNAGCIKAMLADGQIEATREASTTFDTIGDYELARSAAQAGLVQFEGMHKLRPDNQDALYLLTQAWTGYGFAFAEDDYERALDAGDDDAAEYHKKRAKMAYDRALFYGLQLLNHRAEGFEQAKKSEQTLKAWLQKNFDDAKEDTPNLFWTGYAWLAKTNVQKEDPAVVAELYVGVAMLERVAELDPSYGDWSVYTALGAYHARTGLAELDEAKKFFDLALAKTQRKSLIVQLNYATRYACVKADRALYESMLNEVLQADDPDPNQRLENAIAKRRAKRWLTKQHMMDCGMDLSAPAPAAAPAAAPPAQASPPAKPR